MSVRNEIKAQIIRAGTAGRTVFPTCLLSCNERASATKKSWNWLMCWGMTSYGRNGGRDK